MIAPLEDDQGYYTLLDAAQRLIPGAYDRTTLTYRQPGAMGGGTFGSDMPSGPSTMGAATIAERELEGGSVVRRARWSGLSRWRKHAA